LFLFANEKLKLPCVSFCKCEVKVALFLFANAKLNLPFFFLFLPENEDYLQEMSHSIDFKVKLKLPSFFLQKETRQL
jgi:hypothetical protein